MPRRGMSHQESVSVLIPSQRTLLWSRVQIVSFRVSQDWDRPWSSSKFKLPSFVVWCCSPFICTTFANVFYQLNKSIFFLNYSSLLCRELKSWTWNDSLSTLLLSYFVIRYRLNDCFRLQVFWLILVYSKVLISIVSLNFAKDLWFLRNDLIAHFTFIPFNKIYLSADW